MILPCLCHYFENKLKFLMLVVKSISMNTYHCQMFKNLEFLPVAVLIKRKTYIVASNNMLVSISCSALFRFWIMGRLTPSLPPHPLPSKTKRNYILLNPR